MHSFGLVPHRSKKLHNLLYIYIYICIYIVSKVGDRCRGLPEFFLFNSYSTEV